MANKIRILRSASTNTPASLLQGELANSEVGSPNAVNELFIGTAGPTVFKLIQNSNGQPAQPTAGLGTATITGADWLVFDDAGSPARALVSGIDLSLFNNTTSGFISGNESISLSGDVTGTGTTAITTTINAKFLRNVTSGYVGGDVTVSGTTPVSPTQGDIWFDTSATASVAWGDVTGTPTTLTGYGITDAVESVTASTGITVGGTANDPTVALDYLGLDNFIDSATNLEGTAIATTDTIIYHDATDNNVKKGLVSDLPFGVGSGDISRVNITAGVGLSGTQDTLTGDHVQTLALDFSELTDMTASISGTTEFILQNGTTESRKAASEIDLQFLNNSQGWQANDPNTVLTTSTGSATWNWIIDEDTMVSNSAAHVPTQQSVKAYVDNAVTSAISYKGAYNASTNTPALDTGSPVISAGDMYTVTVAGTFFTVAVEVGDVLIAEVDSSDAAALSDWTIVQTNLSYATTTVPGYIELATQAEVDGASDTTRAVVPNYLHNTTFDCGTF